MSELEQPPIPPGNSEEQVHATSNPVSRRGYFRAVGVGALASVGAASVWAAASRIGAAQDVIDPEKLLLAPQDFADVGLEEVRRPEQRETRNGVHAAQVVLQRDSLRLYQSVVVFPNDGAARQALQALQYGQAGETDQAANNYASRWGEDSLLITGRQGDKDAVSVVLRRGPIFVRLTLTGTRDTRIMNRFAQRADEKVRAWQA